MLSTAAVVATGSGFSTTVAALDVAAAITAKARPWSSAMAGLVMPPPRPDPEIPRATIESHQSRTAVLAFFDPDDMVHCFEHGDVVCSIDPDAQDYSAQFDNELTVLAHPNSLHTASDISSTPMTPLGILTRQAPISGDDNRVYMSVTVQGVCTVNNAWLVVDAPGMPRICSDTPPGTRICVVAQYPAPPSKFLAAILVVYDEPSCLIHLQ